MRKMRGLSVSESKRRGLDILSASADMISAGYLETKGDMLKLTRKGIVISNTIITKLYQAADL